MKNLLKRIMELFNGSFILIDELILVKKTNLYFSLENIETEIDLKCKLLEWCSRDACKRQYYQQEWRNVKYQNLILDRLNLILETNFSKDDMHLIYTKLGNAVNHKLTIDFVNSNYDLNILKD